MCQPSKLWTQTDRDSVSGPILEMLSGCYLSTCSARLTRVMRTLSSHAFREDELAGVKKVLNTCVLSFSIVSRVTGTKMMLGECP